MNAEEFVLRIQENVDELMSGEQSKRVMMGVYTALIGFEVETLHAQSHAFQTLFATLQVINDQLWIHNLVRPENAARAVGYAMHAYNISENRYALQA